MTERTKDYNIELLTPCFCHGEDSRNNPEIRVASIRGQIREWRRMRNAEVGDRQLSSDERIENSVSQVWGGSCHTWNARKSKSESTMIASRVALELDWELATHLAKKPLLPHKKSPQREAVFGKEEFMLKLRRLVGCTDTLWAEAKRDVQTWLLLGCLGQRANRAAGSVWRRDWRFASIEDFRKQLLSVQIPQNWDVRVCDQAFDDAEEVRTVASDTVDNVQYFGGINPRRKPSPTKMKVVRSGGSFHLLLFAATANLLDDAIECLKTKPNPERWQNLTFRKL